MREDINKVAQTNSAFVNDTDIQGKPINSIPKPQRNIGINLSDEFLSNIVGEGTSSHFDISKINSFSQASQNREVIYELLDTMAEDSTISAILEVYAEDATETNEEGRIVYVQSDDTDCIKYITYLLDTMNVDKNIYKWAYSLCKYGDLYLRLYRNSDLSDGLFNEEEKLKSEHQKQLRQEIENYKRLHEGVLPTKEEVQKLNENIIIKLYNGQDKYSHYVEMVANPGEMFELTKFGKSYAYIKAPNVSTNVKKDSLLSSYYMYSFKKRDIEIYQPTEFVHACLEDNSSRCPEEVEIFMSDTATTPYTYTVKRGQSLLYNSFKIWRQMMLLENSLLLNRLSKSSILRVIGVEVGDMPKENVGKHLLGVKQLIEQKSAIGQGQSLQEYTNPGVMENNIYVPTHNGIGTISTQQIGGDVDVKGLADVDYFRNKLFGAVRIPQQYMGFTDDNTGFNGGTSLSLISSRYAKMIKRIQATLIQLITDAINLMLIDKGLEGKYLGKFSLHMTPPTTQEELDRTDKLSNKVNMVRDIMDLLADIEDPIAKLKILKNLISTVVTDADVLDILQEEIDKLEEQLNEPELIPGEDDWGDTETPDMDFGSAGFSGPSSSPSVGPENSMSDLPAEESGEPTEGSEDMLPTPADLNAGDFSDNTNSEL